MSLLAEMNQKALSLGLPLSVHLDITYRCNERCVHCYLDHDDHGEMTTAEIVDVLTSSPMPVSFFSPSAAVKFSCAGTFLKSWNGRGNCCST